MSFSYYSILGLDDSASTEEVNEAYRNLARACHPDKHQKNKELFENFMKSLNEAKEVLTGKSERKNRWSATDDSTRYQMLLRENDQLKKMIAILNEDLRKANQERDRYNNELNLLHKATSTARALQFELDTLQAQWMRQKSIKRIGILSFLVVFFGLSFFINQFVFTQHQLTHIQHRLPFLIDSIAIFNSTDTLHSAAYFRKNEIRYLSAQLKIQPIEQEKRKINLQLRWINPDGTLSRYPKDAKHQYSFSHDIVYDPAHPTINIPGWGNKTRSFFQAGEHSFEIWYQGHIIEKTFIEVSEK